MGKETYNDLGKIEITEEVLSTIAGIATVECYGVVGMASRKIKDGIVELLGQENLSRGVEVSVDGDQVVVNLDIIVGYGVRITEVARNVKEKVKYAIESTSSLGVRKVNINVRGIRVGK